MAADLPSLLQQCRDVIEQMEYRRDLLKYEITRKTLFIEQCRDEDLPPSQRLVLPGDVIDLDAFNQDRGTELHWTGTSGLKITLIAGLERVNSEECQVDTISFRSGFIRQPTGIQQFAHTLRVLELYENRLRTLRGVDQLVNLEILDVSYNRLGKLEPEVLAPLVKLKRFYCAENKLLEVPEGVFAHMQELEVLDLGGNQLRRVQGVNGLAKLRELWLGKNKITKIEGLEALPSLVRISLQSNRIVQIENLAHLGGSLEELYLSDQGISQLDTGDGSLAALVKLTTLDLTNNRITTLQHGNFPTSSLTKLTDLWLAANRLVGFEEVEWLAKECSMPVLDTLVFERNAEVEKEPRYRDRVKELFPTLTYIDATPCV